MLTMIFVSDSIWLFMDNFGYESDSDIDSHSSLASDEVMPVFDFERLCRNPYRWA